MVLEIFYIKQESRIVKALNKTYIEIGLYIKNFIAIFVVFAVSWYNHWWNMYFPKNMSTARFRIGKDESKTNTVSNGCYYVQGVFRKLVFYGNVIVLIWIIVLYMMVFVCV